MNKSQNLKFKKIVFDWQIKFKNNPNLSLMLKFTLFPTTFIANFHPDPITIKETSSDWPVQRLWTSSAPKAMFKKAIGHKTFPPNCTPSRVPWPLEWKSLSVNLRCTLDRNRKMTPPATSLRAATFRQCEIQFSNPIKTPIMRFPCIIRCCANRERESEV